MKNFRTVAVFFFLCALLTWPVSAAENIQIGAQAFVLLDADSGRILCGENYDQELPIASTTKIMTAIVALEEKTLSEQITVKSEYLKEGSSMYLREGETVSLEDLLYGLMLSSGNDAAESIAALCSDREMDFVSKMNEKSAELGLQHTAFANPSGLDAEGHYSSAADLARIFAYSLKNESFLRLCSTTSAVLGERSMRNHNKLLFSFPGCCGGKTGYTSNAGRTLVTCCERNGIRLVAVTLCDSLDWEDHAALYEYGFSRFHRECPVFFGQSCGTLRVSGGIVPFVSLTALGSCSVLLAEGESVSLCTELPETICAPISIGEQVGMLRVFVGQDEVGCVTIAAAEGVSTEEVTNNSLFFHFFSQVFGKQDNRWKTDFKK